MAELLPCPFCGGKAAFVPRAVNMTLQKDPSDPKFGVSVICGKCGSESPNMVDEGHAARAWNRRASIGDTPAPQSTEGGTAGAPVEDCTCPYVTSDSERICNKCGRRHDGGPHPHAPIGVIASSEPCRYADQCNEEGTCANGCQDRAGGQHG